MIINLVVNLAVIMGLAVFAHGLYALGRNVFLNYRNRKDAGPLHAALEKMGENVKVRNSKVSANNIQDTFD